LEYEFLAFHYLFDPRKRQGLDFPVFSRYHQRSEAKSKRKAQRYQNFASKLPLFMSEGEVARPQSILCA
jgi:hypothetical protein